MANVEAGTVTVNVEPVFDDLKEAMNRAFVIPEPTQPERAASELRLEAAKLAVRAHESLHLDGPVIETAQVVAGFVIDGTVASSVGAEPASVAEHDEYVVEVPGRGYVGSTYLSGLVDENQVVPFLSKGDADGEAERVAGRYRAVGCPEVAETVRVASRKVTISRGAWSAE